MAGLVPAIHVFLLLGTKDVDARHKAGHDEWMESMLNLVDEPSDPSSHS
jgi:3'-phosphoadenosine 5'-phosphosulfate sulfotransferase